MLSLKISREKLSYIVYKCRRNFGCSRWLFLTHYDVLNLKTNCSQKEIRDAYIKLCKENHPDCNDKNPNLHKKFLRINEAYNVLSKPRSRQTYDLSIAYLREDRKIRNVIVKDHDTDDYRSAWRDPSFYHNRKEEFMNYDPIPDDQYYGIKGVKRVSNGTLFVVFLSLSIVCGLIQILTIKTVYYASIKKSNDSRNSLMSQEYRRLSQENARILQELKEKSESQTEEEFYEELKRSYHENLEKISPNYVKK